MIGSRAEGVIASGRSKIDRRRTDHRVRPSQAPVAAAPTVKTPRSSLDTTFVRLIFQSPGQNGRSKRRGSTLSGDANVNSHANNPTRPLGSVRRPQILADRGRPACGSKDSGMCGFRTSRSGQVPVRPGHLLLRDQAPAVRAGDRRRRCGVLRAALARARRDRDRHRSTRVSDQALERRRLGPVDGSVGLRAASRGDARGRARVPSRWCNTIADVIRYGQARDEFRPSTPMPPLFGSRR